MSAIASYITGNSTVWPRTCLGWQQGKHKNFLFCLASMWGIHRSPVLWEIVPCHDIIDHHLPKASKDRPTVFYGISLRNSPQPQIWQCSLIHVSTSMWLLLCICEIHWFIVSIGWYFPFLFFSFCLWWFINRLNAYSITMHRVHISTYWFVKCTGAPFVNVLEESYYRVNVPSTQVCVHLKSQ